MKILPILVGLLLVLSVTDHPADAQVGRYQVVSVGTPAVAILVDTLLGCTWHLASMPGSRELWFAFLPRDGVPPGENKRAALIPRECIRLDGFMLGGSMQSGEPERKP